MSDMPESPSVTCATCEACCCRLEVMLISDTGVPDQFVETDEWGSWHMARLEDGWCAALDRSTMLCRIYAQRPGICRDYQAGEPDCLEQRAQLGSRA